MGRQLEKYLQQLSQSQSEVNSPFGVASGMNSMRGSAMPVTRTSSRRRSRRSKKSREVEGFEALPTLVEGRVVTGEVPKFLSRDQTRDTPSRSRETKGVEPSIRCCLKSMPSIPEGCTLTEVPDLPQESSSSESAGKRSRRSSKKSRESKRSTRSRKTRGEGSIKSLRKSKASRKSSRSKRSRTTSPVRSIKTLRVSKRKTSHGESTRKPSHVEGSVKSSRTVPFSLAAELWDRAVGRPTKPRSRKTTKGCRPSGRSEKTERLSDAKTNRTKSSSNRPGFLDFPVSQDFLKKSKHSEKKVVSPFERRLLKKEAARVKAENCLIKYLDGERYIARNYHMASLHKRLNDLSA